MAGAKRLVVGASGFLGSHVTRQLVDRSDDVRVLIRRTSSTKAIENLIEKGDVEYHYGDIFDDAALRAAMAGCDDVFYCVVDTRAWLRDPSPLFRTNVEGLRHVLDAAPLWAMYAMGYAGDVVRTMFRRDFQLTSRSVRLMHIWPTLDHGKAERELGWQPEPIQQSIARATQFYRERLRSRR